MNKLDTIKLDNGLTIYLYNDKKKHSTFFQFITFFGGIDKDFIYNNQEYHMQDGIAHILEHYLVECNENGNFLELLGERQMNTNASTSYKSTRFYFETVTDVEFGIKTLLEGLNNVVFTEEKLEKLKNPILQEIRGKSDNKFYHSNIMNMNNLFHNYKYRSVGGDINEVINTTVEDLEVCYNAFWQPCNQAIVIAGNFNKERIIKQITSFYKKLDKTYYPLERIVINELDTVKKKSDILVYRTPLSFVEFSFKVNIKSLSPKERVDLDFYLLCFSRSHFGVVSPLFKKLTDKKVITSGIYCGNYTINDYLIINVSAYTYDVKLFKKSILDKIKSLDDFREDLFDLEKKNAIITLILREDSIISTIIPFLDNLVNYNYPYLDTISDIEKLKYNDYVETVKNMDFSNYTVTTIIDKEKEG